MPKLIVLALIVGVIFHVTRHGRRYPADQISKWMAFAFLPAHGEDRHRLRGAGKALARVMNAHREEVRQLEKRWAKEEEDWRMAIDRLGTRQAPEQPASCGGLTLDPTADVLRWTNLEGVVHSLPLDGLTTHLETDDPSNWVIVIRDRHGDQYSTSYSRAEHPSSERVRDFKDLVNRSARRRTQCQQKQEDERRQLDGKYAEAKAAYVSQRAALRESLASDPTLSEARARWNKAAKAWRDTTGSMPSASRW